MTATEPPRHTSDHTDESKIKNPILVTDASLFGNHRSMVTMSTVTKFGRTGYHTQSTVTEKKK